MSKLEKRVRIDAAAQPSGAHTCCPSGLRPEMQGWGEAGRPCLCGPPKPGTVWGTRRRAWPRSLAPQHGAAARAPAQALPHPWWERKAASQARADCSCPAATRGCGWPRPHPRCPLQAGRHSAGSSAFHPVHRGTPGLCFFSSESG